MPWYVGNMLKHIVIPIMWSNGLPQGPFELLQHEIQICSRKQSSKTLSFSAKNLKMIKQ